MRIKNTVRSNFSEVILVKENATGFIFINYRDVSESLKMSLSPVRLESRVLVHAT